MLHASAITLLTISAAVSTPVSAQGNAMSWPQRPIRIVVGFPPGGGIDVVARLLAVRLSDSLGQQVVVDNRSGANGIVATDIVAKSNADGHTLFIGTTGNLSVNPVLAANLPFNIERDFAPIMQTSSVPFLLYMNSKVPAKSLDDPIAHVKANAGKVNFYSAGNGSLPQLAGELLNNVAGIKAMNIPETREKFIAQGTDPVDSNPKTFAAFMIAESAKWARVIKDANIWAD